MTPFEEAGYTKDTKFRALVNYEELNKDDIVTLEHDDGTTWPYFTTDDGRTAEMYLPGLTAGHPQMLEVYEDPATPLQQRVTELEKVIEQLKEKGIV